MIIYAINPRLRHSSWRVNGKRSKLPLSTPVLERVLAEAVEKKEKTKVSTKVEIAPGLHEQFRESLLGIEDETPKEREDAVRKARERREKRREKLPKSRPSVAPADLW